MANRTTVKTVNLTVDQKDILERAAAKLSISVADLLRMCSLRESYKILEVNTNN